MTTSEDSSSFLLPVISVIAVSYNHERYVIEALESIASQSVSEIELIFCDDASSDRSVEIATAWLSQSRLSYRTILHQTNQGLCRTLNEARLLCRGEFLQYVSCDDRLHPTKFERQLQAFSQSADSVAVICSDANLIDDSGSPMPPFLFTRRFATPDISSQSGLYKQLVRGEPCIAAPSALIRKSALDEIGWYDENLSTEDYDTWLRLLRKYDIIVLSDPLVDYRIHKHNFHTYLDKNNQWRHVRYQILKKHLDDPYVR
ncbi:MAG TPA: glycosyltransferase, partial [Planctomicrobium sp.]|nr:glycosyltransferase [Planctomicrobium sp.]